MSSHHFVKEGQEPALLILDAIALSRAEPVLEWAPQILVAESSIAEILSWAIKVDVAFGKDAETLKKLLAHQTPVRVVETRDDLLGNALCFLLDLKQSHVTILCHDPAERVERLREFESRMDISMMSSTEKWSLVYSGRFLKWVPAGAEMRFYTREKLKIDGVLQSSAQYTADHDGFVEVESDHSFWVIELL